MDSKVQAQTDCVCQDADVSRVLDGTEQLLARDVMQCGVVSIDMKEPIQKAVMLLIERDISGLPVTRGGQLEGMLSEKDLLRLLYETKYLPGLVEDYMTYGAQSLDVETRLAVIHENLAHHSFRRVPILLEGRIAGMITRSDLIRVYKERFRPPTARSEATGKSELLAGDVMKCGLLTVHPDTPLYDAMDMIARHHVTGLPVVDKGLHLLGVITEKDLLDCVDKAEAIGASVGAYMTEDVVAFDRKTNLRCICECLITNDFHRVPILDGTRLVGIISRSDILKHRAAIFRL
ncbi:MAG: CBS domain-containing protein [Sedimentisphaerales bacterium]|nr:CBS domain-containing protein [Sedimentisphaerales bacterium]